MTMTAQADTILEHDGTGRGYIGSAFRAAVEFVQQRGLGASIRERVSPETARLMEKPPFAFAWMPARPLDELQDALGALGGRQACVDLGVAAGRNLGGSVIAPVLRMATSLFGNTPATVFQNLERFYSMVLRGMTFEYQALGDREGLVTARALGSGVPTALFDVTRGNLAFVFELCGSSGRVSEPEDVRIDAQKGEARYRVSWG
jgi:hypothetical protein